MREGNRQERIRSTRRVRDDRRPSVRTSSQQTSSHRDRPPAVLETQNHIKKRKRRSSSASATRRSEVGGSRKPDYSRGNQTSSNAKKVIKRGNKMPLKTNGISGRGHSISSSKKKKSVFMLAGKVIFTFLYYTVTVAMISIAVLFALNMNSGTSVMGYRLLNVITNSMVPNEDAKVQGKIKGFYSNDVVVVKETKYSAIQVGDVVSYRMDLPGETYLTHRVVGKEKEIPDVKGGPFLLTQGDVNEYQDPPVPEKRIVGTVKFVIPYLGYFIQFIRDNFLICLIFILGLFGTMLVLKLYLFGGENNS